LITGETGVGKEGIARAIHLRGPRRERAFVTINAAGFSESLVESELFGHEKGAFTGAHAQHRGVFEQADGGTLFLDEIGELPLSMQARLLRVLETWEIRRVGGESTVRVDVRLVCATHRDLGALVENEAFREDLYYRLARLPIHLSALRERPDDIAPLAEHFLSLARAELGPRTLSEAAIARLCRHAWPGNARELRNVVESAAAFTAGIVDAKDIDAALARTPGMRDRAPTIAGLDHVMRKHANNQTAAARELGVPRSTLRDRIERAKRKSQRPPPVE
jgi:DNA-binding NtrC family response regulator